MKCYQYLILSFYFCFGSSISSLSQPLTLKGFFVGFPGDEGIFEISIGTEVKLWRSISLEALYQKRNESSDNDYFRNIYLISVNYYPDFNKRFFHNSYLSSVYRYADFIQHPDQSDFPEYHYYTNSAGLLFGKNLHFGKRFLFDISTGPFMYFSSAANAIRHDTPNILGSLMLMINDQLDWRAYFKFGFKIGHIPD